MQIKTTETDAGRTISIRADKQLDWKIHTVTSQAVILASSPWVHNIEIDLRKTRVIRDSGLSLLSMMCEKSGLSRGHIGLVNCNPELRTRIIKSKLGEYLSMT